MEYVLGCQTHPSVSIQIWIILAACLLEVWSFLTANISTFLEDAASVLCPLYLFINNDEPRGT